MRLQDGGGLGYEAVVDSEGRVSTFSVVEAEDKHVNKHKGKVWSLPFTVTPVGAGDYFFYLKNTGTAELLITDIRIDAATAEVVTFNIVSGTPVYTSKTDITPTNRNLSSAINPDVTVNFDTNTTGLTDEGELYFLTCEANSLSHVRMSSNVILTPGGSISLIATVGGIALKGMVSLVGTNK